MANCPDIKSDEIRRQLCGLFYYPGECETRCKNLYNRWLATEPTVRKLEGKDLPVYSGPKIKLDVDVKADGGYLDLVNAFCEQEEEMCERACEKHHDDKVCWVVEFAAYLNYRERISVVEGK